MIGKNRATVLLIGVLISLSMGLAFAIDPPHDASVPAEPVDCSNCHVGHNAPGGSLTSYASNENLCISCHTSAAWASEKPFNSADQADQSTQSGSSHRWDVRMAPVGDPGYDAADYGPASPYGLRKPAADRTNPQPDEIQNINLNTMLVKFDYTISCSVCHGQHGQGPEPWDPGAPSYGGAGTGKGRHFMRTANELNQLCEDCHYYRAQSYSRAKGEDGSYAADGVRKFSHPVGEALNSQGYDRSAPLDYDGQPQTGAPRYGGNSAGDSNSTNNVALDKDGKVRCLSCHRMHYVDSNGGTQDQP